MLLTPPDAIYCARFLEKMQKLRVAGFETRDIVHQVRYSQLITGLVPCVYCSTEREAENLGFFFSTLFKILKEWEDKQRFSEECMNTPGFEGCDNEKFREMLSSCYNRVSIILGKCFDSDDYMKQRNSLVVLWKLTPEFPTTSSMADQLLAYTSKVKDSGMSDLKVLAQRYNDKVQELKRERWPSPSRKLPSPARKRSATPDLNKKRPRTTSKPGKVQEDSHSRPGREDKGKERRSYGDTHFSRHGQSSVRDRPSHHESHRDHSVKKHQRLS